MGDVDSLMAELGLAEPAGTTASTGATGTTGTPTATTPVVSAVPQGNDVDALLADVMGTGPPVAIAPAAAPAAAQGLGLDLGLDLGLPPTPAPASSSSVAGAAGPGAAWAQRQAAGLAPGQAAANGAHGGPLSAASTVAGARGGGSGSGPLRAADMATHTPDGRRVTHHGPPCAACGEMVIGKVLGALDKSWHEECFVCATCKKPFPGGRFVEHEGSPFCENDYSAIFCPCCKACGSPIIDSCIEAGEYKYHPEHFGCLGCGVKLQGRPYRLDENGDAFCTKCREAKRVAVDGPQHTCGRCKMLITGEWIMYKGQTVCEHHLQCEECGCAFKNGNSREYEGSLLCADDYDRMMKQMCESCKKPILGRQVSALGKVWHPEHFVCTTCKSAFQGGSYFVHEGKPYCETHYTAEFGDVCAKCQKPCARDVVEFEGKKYHPEHLVCSGCDVQLGGKAKAFAWESKPLCSKCFDKLPAHIRKQIRQKLAQTQKAAKARAKAEKKAAKAG